MIKKFIDWIGLKRRLHELPAKQVPLFKEGQIWWCCISENVGTEENGKGRDFTRPVIIYRKFDRYSFSAIPLTSKMRTGSWYITFNFKNVNQTAILNQTRVLSAKRLRYLIGTLPAHDFDTIKAGFGRLYL